MRILAIRTKGIARPFIHAALIKAFRGLGGHVLDLNVPCSPDQLRTFLDQAKRGRFKAIFTLDLGGDPFFIERLKETQWALRIPLIVWFVDDPEGYGFPGSCEPDWTLAFCWDRQMVEGGGRDADGRLFYLPLATDPSVFYPEAMEISSGGVFAGSTVHRNPVLERIAETTPGLADDVDSLWAVYRTDLRTSIHDLTWDLVSRKTGKPREAVQIDPLWRLWFHACLYRLGMMKRQVLVSRILGRDGRVFGDKAWRSVLAEGVYRGKVAYGHDLREAYNRSGFVLETRQPQARTGLTQRVFDGAACGVPLLAEWSPEIEALMEPEMELSCFQSLEEGVESSTRYLQDLPAARTIGQSGLRRVLSHHTYLHRAKQILDTFERFF